MKTKWLWPVGIVILGIAYVGFQKYKSSAESTRNAPLEAKVEKGPIEQTVDATGEVSPLNRVEIKPPIQGRIEKLLVDEGAVVKAGDVLAWLSSSDRAAIMDAARAQGADQLKYWQDAYKPTPIIAPLSGVIILRNVVVGQTVDATTVLFAMSDKLIVLAQVDESDIGRVRLKMPARITLDAYPDHTIEGTVFQILNEGKNVSNVITYGVKIEPKNIPPFFRSQMTANVSLIIKREEDALLIPTAALKIGRDGEKKVLVPGPDGKSQSVSVETGIESAQYVQVLSGLNVGDTIYISTKRYSPQKAPQSSPLTLGNRPQQRGNSGGGASRRGGAGS